ncbi:hypothetical protein HK101_005334, partial [Irineochytrium annulatum]
MLRTVVLALATAIATHASPTQQQQVVAQLIDAVVPGLTIGLSESLAARGPLDGRLMLLISKNPKIEPRFGISVMTKGADGSIVYGDSQQVFGRDVDGWDGGAIAFGGEAVAAGEVDGFPLRALEDVPNGTYSVQPFLNVYKTYHRSDGHTVKLHPDGGEGQHMFVSPGNLYSEPRTVRIENGVVVEGSSELVLDKVIGPIKPANDETEYIRRIRIKSKLLSEFWGEDVYISSVILLPYGFWDHPDARYPVVVYQGHFSAGWSTPVMFRDKPKDEYCEAYACVEQEYGYHFYKNWTATEGSSPYVGNRVITMTIQHANPYYDDSYAVNSANLGPYGDAIETELIPEVERLYRGIGQGWSRVLTGGSTGGWESVAVQMFYPDNYSGAFAACPDPLDFRAYHTGNIYEDSNAYWMDASWRRTPRPFMRNRLGHLWGTLEEANLMELALGTNSRSGEQFDIWQAVFGPVGANGYPEPVFNKKTGAINHTTAAYWRENFDLSYILAREWSTLGPKLAGKLHIMTGTMDSFYLDGGVRLFEKRARNLTDPAWEGTFEYGYDADGVGFEHCWGGDANVLVSVSRLTLNQRLHRRYIKQMLRFAPEG